jgi:hypothetical protein
MMVSKPAGMIALLLTLVACTALSGADGLAIRPELNAVRYCLEERGASSSLRLTFYLTYRNESDAPVILLRVYRLQGYSLIRSIDGRAGGGPALRGSVQKTRMLDTTKIDDSKLEPELFDVLAPGGTVGGRQVVVLIPFPLRDHSSGQPMSTGDYLLRMVIDHWPDSHAPGLRLRERWKDRGFLWIEPIETTPVVVHIDQDTKPVRCGGRVD